MRKFKDMLRNTLTYGSSILVICLLLLIVGYIFLTGGKTFNFKMFVADYYEKPYFLTCETKSDLFHLENKNDIFYSQNWGIGLKDTTDLNGKKVIEIVYVDNLSPLKNAFLKENNNAFEVKSGLLINRIIIKNSDVAALYTAEIGASQMALALDEGIILTELYLLQMGGGIRGSLLSTVYLILLTLLMVIPLGVISAIYFTTLAKNNRFNRFLLALIDMISGIPSIIFGLLGLMCFIPIVSKMSGTSGGSIISGALTMTIMLLPIVIKTTMEAIYTIPESYKSASLALGASTSQTIFKIILPNALGGILTSVLLAIGRIIGESAALIFAIGTYISDSVSLTGTSTTLAVHIWSLIGGENPNYKAASSISIVILLVVLILNLTVKLISYKLDKARIK